MKRRTWLQGSAGLLAGAGAGTGLLASSRLWAQQNLSQPPDARFLLVFLRGGYDSLSLLVPRERGFYDEVRPHIGIPPAANGKPGVLPMAGDWGLHPALAGNVWPLVQAGQARFVAFAGSHNSSRSHFETQDSIELGLAGRLTDGAGAAGYHSGFLNRLAAEVLGRGSAMAFSDRVPLAFSGPLPVANLSLRGNPGNSPTAGLRTAMQTMYSQHPLQAQVDTAFALRAHLARQLAEERAGAAAQAALAPVTPASPAMDGARASMAAPDMAPSMASSMAASSADQAASRQAISARGFELEARRIGQLMREQCSLGFVDVGGWDTHVNQGAATGLLANRFEELGRGLVALADTLGSAAWQRTVVVVASEFGRTTRENGNRGTDHGHGTVYWVLGGGLASADQPVAGAQQAISAATLFQNRDQPVLNDYRALIGGLLARQFGLGPAALDRVFSAVQPQDLGLL